MTARQRLAVAYMLAILASTLLILGLMLARVDAAPRLPRDRTPVATSTSTPTRTTCVMSRYPQADNCHPDRRPASPAPRPH